MERENKIKIIIWIIELICFIIDILIFSFSLWLTKKIKIFYIIYFSLSCIFFLCRTLFITIFLFFKKKWLNILIILNIIIISFSIIFWIFGLLILIYNYIEFNNYYRNCPYNNNELNLQLKRRCELFNINNNSRYSYQYICSFDSSEDFDSKNKLSEKIEQDKIICVKPKLIEMKNIILKNFVNFYNDSVIYYFCSRTNIPKDYSFIAQKNCTDEKKYLMLIFLISSCAHFIDFIFSIIEAILSLKNKNKNNINLKKNSISDSSLNEKTKILNKMNYSKINVSGKLKAMILLSIFEKKIDFNNLFLNDKINQNLTDLFLMNKKYLEKYYYNEIKNLVYNNKNIIDRINNINIDTLTLSYFDDIASEFDVKKLKKIDKKLSFLKEMVSIPFDAQTKEIKLSNSKNIKIYIDYIFINTKIFIFFQDIFKIKFYQQKMYFKSIDDDENLLKNDIKNKFIISSEIISNEEKSENNVIKNEIIGLRNEINELKNELKKKDIIKDEGKIKMQKLENDYSKIKNSNKIEELIKQLEIKDKELKEIIYLSP